MEYGKEDWPDEWNDADRMKGGNMYGWQFGAILLIAVIVVVGLLF